MKSLLPIILAATILIFTSCGKSLFNKKDTEPSLSQVTQNIHAPSNNCDATLAEMEGMGINSLRNQLDQTVRRITPTEYNRLVNGAKVHRRARIGSRYSNTDVALAVEESIDTLNRMGEWLYQEQATPHAPYITTSDYYTPNSSYSSNSESYSSDRDSIGLSDEGSNSSFVSYGISAGDATADAGFCLSGRKRARVRGRDYEVSLSYTAVKSRYTLRAHSIDRDGRRDPISFKNCRQDPRFQEWTRLPRSQPDINECESRNCANFDID